MKEKWIDVAKCLAILAVMLDHVNGVLYTNQAIAYASYYSTGLFVLVMGVSTYWSFANTKIPVWKKVLERIRSMIVPYVIAVALFYCVMFKNFDLVQYLKYCVLFNISGPHYYVLLFLHLIMASPVLVCFLRERKCVCNTVRDATLELAFGGGRRYFFFPNDII